MLQGGFGMEVGGSYAGFSASVAMDFDKFKQSSTFSQNYGSHQYTLQSGSDSLPEPISLKLKTIDLALEVWIQSTGRGTMSWLLLGFVHRMTNSTCRQESRTLNEHSLNTQHIRWRQLLLVINKLIMIHLSPIHTFQKREFEFFL